MAPSTEPNGGGFAAAMRRAPVALILALALALAGALIPAAAPGVPMPAALTPAVALAADDIEVTTAARYTVDPAAGRVHVAVDITAVNRKPNRVSGGTVTRYFYAGVNLAIQREARNVHATQRGAEIKVAIAKRKGFRQAAVQFRENIYFGQTAQVRLTFDLPGGAPRSASDVRVGPAFATFMAWAFGDEGTVRVEVPSSFRVTTSGATLEAQPGQDGLAAWTAETSRPLEWYALINATDDAALTRERLALPGGEAVVIRGWPDDERWLARVRTLLRDGVPELVRQIGLAWPVDGALTITEVHTPLLEGYAGLYDPTRDEITISEDLDDLTIVHEASHAWFKTTLFTGRWITEGLADEYAARVLRELGRDYPGPGAVKRKAKLAFPLADWPPPAPIESEDGDAREQYGYDASWLVMRGVVGIVGADGMREVFAAASDGTTAYVGDASPEHTTQPNDWRRFLDLTDALGARPGVEDLLVKWVLDAKAQTLLPARADARLAYSDLVDAGGGWAAPLVVRMAMDHWDFTGAGGTIRQATRVLETRDTISALAGTAGLTPDTGSEAGYETASSSAELSVVAEREDASLAVLGEVVAATKAVSAPRDWLADLGLDGADPATVLAAAGSAWEGGDLDVARTTAADVVARVAAAPEAGRTKAVAYAAGGLVVILLLAGLVALLVTRRRESAGRRSRAAAFSMAATGPDPAGAASLPDGPPPYATLPPQGLPAEPPGEPASEEAGADRS